MTTNAMSSAAPTKGPASTYPPTVIDIHTHVFNAHHLPLHGMLLRYLGVEKGDGSDKPWRRWLAEKLNRLAVRLVRSGSRGSALVEAHLRMDGGLDEAVLIADLYLRILDEAALGFKSLQGDREKTAEDDEERLLVETLIEVQLAYEKSPSSWNRAGDIDAIYLPHPLEVRAREGQLLRQNDLIGTRAPVAVSMFSMQALEWLLGLAAASIVEWALEDGESFVEFFFRMLGSEAGNVTKIFRSYEKRQNVKLIVHHMMDMECGYPEKASDPVLTVPQQLERMRRLSAPAGSGIVGFAAFDPRRPECMDLALAAIDLGFRGFKFYPPMGYLPHGNEDDAVERNCIRFFELCVEKEIPVFTHCTPSGVQATKGSGLNANPAGWKSLLRQPGMSKLWLCLGHGGGGRQKNCDVDFPGWFATQEEWKPGTNYAYSVVQLCREFPNVYCDFAYLHPLLDRKAGSRPDRENFARNFKAAWSDTSGNYPFASKAMYGSDAHMPLIGTRTAEYLEYFNKLFAGFAPADFPNFTYANAAAFLHLDTPFGGT